MIETRLLMGMPITIEIVDPNATQSEINKIFDYFDFIDKTFSTFKQDSEISRINRDEIKKADWSDDMKTVFALAEKTKKETEGYFDIIDNNGKYNPSGIVKGWAIYCATQILRKAGFENFYVNAGGDIQFYGKNADGELWKTGIKNPFNQKEIVKVVYLKSGEGIATSGNYLRGKHIISPKEKKPADDIASMTVIGPNVFEADRFATAAFAMGEKGIDFIESLKGFEGYMVKKDKHALFTNGFENYVLLN